MSNRAGPCRADSQPHKNKYITYTRLKHLVQGTFLRLGAKSGTWKCVGVRLNKFVGVHMHGDVMGKSTFASTPFIFSHPWALAKMIGEFAMSICASCFSSQSTTDGGSLWWGAKARIQCWRKKIPERIVGAASCVGVPRLGHTSWIISNCERNFGDF